MKNDLGRTLVIFRNHQSSFLYMFFLIIFGCFASILPLSYGVYIMISHFNNYGIASLIPNDFLWLLLFCIALMINAYLTFLTIKQKYRYVAIYENGLRINQHKDIKILWSNINAIFVKKIQYKFFFFKIKKTYQCRIHTKDGKNLLLPRNINNYGNLLTILKSQLYNRLIEQNIKDLEQGQWIRFGPLSMNKMFIHYREHTIKWDSIKLIDVGSGHLRIDLYNQNKSLKIPLDQISNIELFFELIKRSINPFFHSISSSFNTKTI